MLKFKSMIKNSFSVADSGETKMDGMNDERSLSSLNPTFLVSQLQCVHHIQLWHKYDAKFYLSYISESSPIKLISEFMSLSSDVLLT